MEQLAEFDVIPDMGLQTRDTVCAQHEPDLQRAEAPAERELPVAVVGDEAGGGEVVVEVRARDGEGGGEGLAVLDEEGAGGRLALQMRLLGIWKGEGGR